MDELVITIPGCPSRDLSPNGAQSRHWSYRSRAKAAAKRDAFYSAKEAINVLDSRDTLFVFPEGIVDVFTTIAWGSGRRVMDGDNALASCKALFDGLAQAGVVANDKQFRFHPVVQIRDKAGVGYVEVRIAA